jgi:hypothetical protein
MRPKDKKKKKKGENEVLRECYLKIPTLPYLRYLTYICGQ